MADSDLVVEPCCSTTGQSVEFKLDQVGIERPNANEEESAPFDLSRLPFFLARQVVKKMRLERYIKFRACSRYAYALADFNDYRIEFNICSIDIKKKRVIVGPSLNADRVTDRVAWRTATQNNIRVKPYTVNVKTRLTSERCERLYKSFLVKQVIAFQMLIEELVECEPGELVQLMELLEISTLISNVYLKSEIFDFSYVQQLQCLDLASCRISDKQLLSLQAMNLALRGDALTEKGINAFLQEWRSGKRRLEALEICFDVSTNTRSTEAFLKDLNANPIWSPELHSQSIASSIPLHDIQETWSDEPRSFYSVFLADAIEDIYFIEISKSCFSFDYAFNEMEVYYNLLNDDQYFDVFNSCPICFTSCPCPHHQEYSLGRFSKIYPRLWNMIVGALGMTTYGLITYSIFSGDFMRKPLSLCL